MNMSNLHEMCDQIVNWAGNCPEATVSVWLVSIVMTFSQLALFVKRLIVGKNITPTEVITVPVPVPVLSPYVPGDTVLKILKLLKNQDNGWDYSVDKYGHNAKCYHLNYSNMGLTKTTPGRLSITHKGINVDIEKNSDNSDLDRILLEEAFNRRCRLEANKHVVRKQMMDKEAEQKANKELTELLEDCIV